MIPCFNRKNGSVDEGHTKWPDGPGIVARWPHVAHSCSEAL